jgi:hypothetical protein
MLAGAAAAALAPSMAIAAPEDLPAGALVEDVRALRRVYETLHPGLLRYLTPPEAATAFERLEAEAADVRSLEAAYVTLSRFLGRVRCGHTYANFYNQTRAVQARLFDRPDRLPFHFLWLGDRMVVTADPTGTGIAPGSEVVRLNGRPAGEVLAGLMSVARADGGADGKRRRLMSVQATDGYESFDVFHSLLFGARSRHTLEVVGPDGRTRSASVDGLSLEARRAQRKVTEPDGDQPIWTLERLGDAAVLTMGDWGLYDSGWDWRGWLDRQMDQLVADGVPRLIVDVRANEGGIDCGDVLAARLTDRTLRPAPVRRLVRYRRVPDDLKPMLDTWDRSFDDWGDAAVLFDDRYFSLERGAEVDGEIVPKGPRYQGAVSVLVGPQNSSATFNFAQMIQREGLGRLVGETTGGNRRGINGGAFYFVRLPATGLEVDLPLIGQFPPEPQPDAGVEPDVFAPQTSEAIAAGRDAALEAALA